MSEDAEIKPKSSNTLLYICVFFLLIFYWGLFDRAFHGIKPDQHDSGLLIVNGAVYWYAWKKNGWKPFVGGLVGVVVYGLLLLAAGVIAVMYGK
jgi:hypothetical protein